MKSFVPHGYRYLEHITDAYVEAYGNSLSEAFDQSGRALVNLMFDIEKANGLFPVTISAEGTDELELLYNWLEAVLLTVVVEGQIMSEFDIRINLDSMLRLEASIDDRINRYDKTRLQNRSKGGYISCNGSDA